MTASDSLSERRERARGYLEGYEAGLKEAWEEFMGLCGRGYQPREIRVLAKSKLYNLRDRLTAEKRQLEASLGESLDDPLPPDSGVAASEIRRGGTYLVEGGLDRALSIGRSLREQNWECLCIGRMEPSRMAQGLGGTGRLIWLTKTEVPDSAKARLAEVDFMTLSPTSLDMLTTIMIDFLRQDGDKIVILGGLDFLMTYNEFSNLLRLIQNMKDRIALSESMMLVSYDPSLLEERDLKRLRSEIGEHA